MDFHVFRNKMICYKDIANGRKKTLRYFLKWFSKRFTNPFKKASSHAKYLKEAIFQSYTWYTCYTCANNRPYSILHRYLLFACFIVSFDYTCCSYDLTLMHLCRTYFLCITTLRLHHNYHNFYQCTNLPKTKLIKKLNTRLNFKQMMISM